MYKIKLIYKDITNCAQTAKPISRIKQRISDSDNWRTFTFSESTLYMWTLCQLNITFTSVKFRAYWYVKYLFAAIVYTMTKTVNVSKVVNC